MEDLHRRAGSKRFWEEEQERIDLGQSRRQSNQSKGALAEKGRALK